MRHRIIAALPLFVGLALAAGPALSQEGRGSYGHSIYERGGSSGTWHDNRTERINEGFDVTHRFGHDYRKSWDRGEYSDPIVRKGEIVGERGRAWDKESNFMRDYDKTVGQRWRHNAGSWNQGGSSRDYQSGFGHWGGRMRGPSFGAYQGAFGGGLRGFGSGSDDDE